MTKVKKEKKMVMVHSCFDIESGDPLPSACACNLLKTLREAQGMVARGEAEVVKESEYKHICLIDGMARRTPRSATIDAAHIERAFVDGDMEEKHRIKEYGDLNFAFFQSLKKWVPFYKYNEDRANNWGVPVIQHTEDNRTPGGINKETR